MASGWLRWQQVLAKQQYQQEEEILTPYEFKDNVMVSEHSQSSNGMGQQALQDPRLSGWEYKIVRSGSDLFRDPVIFKQLCDEEQQAGWILLEKLDDRRVRFKRPLAMRDVVQSEFLSFDPYRCSYGPSSNLGTWLGGMAALTAMILPAYLGYALVSTTLANSRAQSPTPLPSVMPSSSFSDPENSSAP